ncbi:hypothetical protein F4801DRAFT_499241 [Xylaria longipes]|nr:hypothetical protein F4801DRAFT_499241 [Xylaria longipes]
MMGESMTSIRWRFGGVLFICARLRDFAFWICSGCVLGVPGETCGLVNSTETAHTPAGGSGSGTGMIPVSYRAMSRQCNRNRTDVNADWGLGQRWAGTGCQAGRSGGGSPGDKSRRQDKTRQDAQRNDSKCNSRCNGAAKVGQLGQMGSIPRLLQSGGRVAPPYLDRYWVGRSMRFRSIVNQNPIQFEERRGTQCGAVRCTLHSVHGMA